MQILSYGESLLTPADTLTMSLHVMSEPGRFDLKLSLFDANIKLIRCYPSIFDTKSTLYRYRDDLVWTRLEKSLVPVTISHPGHAGHKN